MLYKYSFYSRSVKSLTPKTHPVLAFTFECLSSLQSCGRFLHRKLANLYGWNKTSVQVTLHSSDPSPGSGVAATYYAVDDPFCFSSQLGFCTTYSGPFNITTQAKHTVYYFSRDVAGNFQALQTSAVDIDETPPHTTATLAGTLSGTSYVNSVKVTLAATDNLSGSRATYYQVDSGATLTYSAPFNVTGNGAHKVTFHSVDYAGNVETNELSTFTIKGSAAVSVVSSHNPSAYDTAVTFTAKVVPGDAGTPTGTVTFKDGASALGVSTLAAGVSTLTTSALSGGVHSITATYSGDANFTGQTSPALSQTVTKLATTTALTGSPNPSGFTRPVTFTALVTAVTGIPTGSVVFKDGVVTLGTISLTAGKAVLTVTSLSGGSHSITAVYGGNVDYNTSTSAVLSETVTKEGTSTALVESSNPSTFDQSVTFTATVTPATPGVPTGTVTFRDGATVLGAPAVVAGKAALTISTLAVGGHSDLGGI